MILVPPISRPDLFFKMSRKLWTDRSTSPAAIPQRVKISKSTLYKQVRSGVAS